MGIARRCRQAGMAEDVGNDDCRHGQVIDQCRRRRMSADVIDRALVATEYIALRLRPGPLELALAVDTSAGQTLRSGA